MWLSVKHHSSTWDGLTGGTKRNVDQFDGRLCASYSQMKAKFGSHFTPRYIQDPTLRSHSRVLATTWAGNRLLPNLNFLCRIWQTARFRITALSERNVFFAVAFQTADLFHVARLNAAFKSSW